MSDMLIIFYSDCCYGFCVPKLFLCFCGGHCEAVLSLVYGPTFCYKWYMSRQFTITVSAVIIVLPMCFPRRIDFLKYARYEFTMR